MLLIVIATAIITAVCLLCWRQVALRTAKLAAQKEFSEEHPWLNKIPSSPPKKIERGPDFTNMATVEVAGCVIGLPSDQFTHDTRPERQNAILYHPRYKLRFFAGAEDQVMDAVKGSVNYTNVYEFVRESFNATERDISKQPDMGALVRHSILLKAKSLMAPVSYEDSCIEFTRGDLRGFICGYPGRSKFLRILLYVPGQEQFIDLSIQKTAHLEMAEVVGLISIIKVKTNPKGGANGRQPFSSDANRTSATAASRRSP